MLASSVLFYLKTGRNLICRSISYNFADKQAHVEQTMRRQLLEKVTSKIGLGNSVETMSRQCPDFRRRNDYRSDHGVPQARHGESSGKQ